MCNNSIVMYALTRKDFTFQDFASRQKNNNKWTRFRGLLPRFTAGRVSHEQRTNRYVQLDIFRKFCFPT